MSRSAAAPLSSPLPPKAASVALFLCGSLLLSSCTTGAIGKEPGTEDDTPLSPQRVAVEFDAIDPHTLLLARADGSLFVSNDQGDSWTLQGCCGHAVSEIAYNSSAQGDICLGGKSKWSCSRDSGHSWTTIPEPTGPKFGKTELIVGGPENNHHLYSTVPLGSFTESMRQAMPRPKRTAGWSNNRGQTWNMSPELTDVDMYMLLSPKGPVLVRFGGEDGVSILECDDSLNCQVTYDGKKDDAVFALVSPFAPSQKVVWPSHRHDDEGGATTFASGGERKQVPFFECKQCGYINGGGSWGMLASAHEDGSLWLSNNGGEDWTQSPAPLPEEDCKLLGNGQEEGGQGMLLCAGKGLYRSLDHASSWQPVALPSQAI